MFLTIDAGPASHSSPSSVEPKAHALGFHGGLHPTLSNLDDAIAEVLEELDAFVDVERGPLLLVVFEDRERFVELRLRGGLDAMLGFGDGGGALGFGGGLSHGASFTARIASICWGVGPRRSRTPEPRRGIADPRRWEASKKDFSIAFSANSRVEDGDDAAVLAGADQASKALFQ